ncbi:MAG: single-stranded DNA-binding protein [Burkholderiales bacterium]|jgi:single-stranded DNA-binding protein|nr:single-stranded DNA-binding protein [Burkholderiales bacterium]
MSLNILALGTLTAAPMDRTSNSGKPFATATLRTATDEGAVIVSVVAFSDSARGALLALGAGDAVTVTGRAKLTQWAGRDGETRSGLSVVADAVLSAYVAAKRRDATHAVRKPREAPGRASGESGDGGPGDWNPLNG